MLPNFPCLCVTLAKSLPLWEPSFLNGGGGQDSLRRGGVLWDLGVPTWLWLFRLCDWVFRTCQAQCQALYMPRFIYSAHFLGKWGPPLPQFAAKEDEFPA